VIKIISPDQFKTIAWKNGQGKTTELVINSAGTLADFDWRLSIASVLESGQFSDFSGYHRQLILLSGNGIKLTHDDKKIDQHKMDELTQPLSMAVFDGASRTVGKLIDGPIKDFNVMTKQHSFKAEVKTYTQQQTASCSTAELNFIYAAKQSIVIQFNHQRIELPQGHLFQASNEAAQYFQVSGQDFIVIALQPLA